MRTVIKYSAQSPCLHLTLTPRFSEVDQLQHPHSSCFNSFPAIRLNPTISDQIRVTFLYLFRASRSQGAEEKSKPSNGN